MMVATIYMQVTNKFFNKLARKSATKVMKVTNKLYNQVARMSSKKFMDSLDNDIKSEEDDTRAKKPFLVSVCVFVPMDLKNRRTDMVLLYNATI